MSHIVLTPCVIAGYLLGGLTIVAIWATVRRCTRATVPSVPTVPATAAVPAMMASNEEPPQYLIYEVPRRLPKLPGPVLRLQTAAQVGKLDA